MYPISVIFQGVIYTVESCSWQWDG